MCVVNHAHLLELLRGAAADDGLCASHPTERGGGAQMACRKDRGLVAIIWGLGIIRDMRDMRGVMGHEGHEGHDGT